MIASDLTLIESYRVLHRGVAAGDFTSREAARRRELLRLASQHWVLFRLETEIVDRALSPFPQEPLRTLDALHLATAVEAQRLVPDLSLLTLDRRVRASGQELGFTVLPAG